jgi:predicted CXXCH cytochrome family protein
VLAAIAAASLALVAGARVGAAPEEPDPLAEMGWAVTGGAAPGYVDEESCEFCHDSIATSYQTVAMSKAFYPPSTEGVIERLGEPFHHRASDRWYEMELVEGRYRFRRYQLDDSGERINELELDVDWVLGSGNHSRTYLIHEPGGELFQLPLAWYSQGRPDPGPQGRWGMAPGYDQRFHLGVGRMVRRECMFCHNAYPDVELGSDTFDKPHRFPAELPSGLGCQRCHGPGARHASAAMSGELDDELLLGSIVNPAKLPARQRDDVCYGCHLQPSISLAGVRRFARPDYSFRPGQLLDDYKVAVDVVEEGRERNERFEINHHPYRLEQSRCFQESDGALSCLTCHDPHSKAPAEELGEWYRSKCLGCHQLEETSAHATEEPDECTSCHMPERRTEDVVQVTMTDHLIQRGPAGPDLVAPRTEREAPVVEAVFLYPHRAPEGVLGDIYLAASSVRATGGTDARHVAELSERLAATPLPQLEPWISLTMGLMRLRQLDSAEAGARAMLERAPSHPLATEWLGLVYAQQGKLDEGLALTREAASAEQARPEALYNLGLLLAQSGDLARAREALQQAIALRSTFRDAWFNLGRVKDLAGEPEGAVEAFRRTLELDPSQERAYVALGETLAALDKRADAMRYLRHGRRAARDPAVVEEALERLSAAAPPSGN